MPVMKKWCFVNYAEYIQETYVIQIIIFITSIHSKASYTKIYKNKFLAKF
jgi:hypothetical protein